VGSTGWMQPCPTLMSGETDRHADSLIVSTSNFAPYDLWYLFGMMICIDSVSGF
jgi:hypothetical protein